MEVYEEEVQNGLDQIIIKAHVLDNLSLLMLFLDLLGSSKNKALFFCQFKSISGITNAIIKACEELSKVKHAAKNAEYENASLIKHFQKNEERINGYQDAPKKYLLYRLLSEFTYPESEPDFTHQKYLENAAKKGIVKHVAQLSNCEILFQERLHGEGKYREKHIINSGLHFRSDDDVDNDFDYRSWEVPASITVFQKDGSLIKIWARFSLRFPKDNPPHSIDIKRFSRIWILFLKGVVLFRHRDGKQTSDLDGYSDKMALVETIWEWFGGYLQEKDHDTYNHCSTVQSICQSLIQHFNRQNDSRFDPYPDSIFKGALIHDFGKLFWPKHVFLMKQDNSAERILDWIKVSHTVLGAVFFSSLIRGMDLVKMENQSSVDLELDLPLSIILGHHLFARNTADGPKESYPTPDQIDDYLSSMNGNLANLKRKFLSLIQSKPSNETPAKPKVAIDTNELLFQGKQIVAIADMYSALCCEKPYRPLHPPEAALETIKDYNFDKEYIVAVEKVMIEPFKKRQ